MNDELVRAEIELRLSVKAQLDFVREKHGVKGNDFSCPVMKRMAEAYSSLDRAELALFTEVE